ncbi:hypothetical protein MTO96_046950, partial [Rhipicephalus appendiculatus]
ACAHVNYGSAAVTKLDNKTHPPLRIRGTIASLRHADY